MNYYEQKAKENYALWEKATDAGDDKAADRAMTEHLNYQREVERLKVA